jgi:hypothetical protein
VHEGDGHAALAGRSEPGGRAEAARGGLSSGGLQGSYGQLDLRVTVFDVIGMPGAAGVLSESADVPVAVAE